MIKASFCSRARYFLSTTTILTLAFTSIGLPAFAAEETEHAIIPEVVQTQVVTPTSNTQPEVAPDPLIAAIARAHILLEQNIVTRTKAQKKPPTTTSTNTPVNVTIAVWDKTSDEITLVDATRDGAKLAVHSPKNFPIRVSVANGVNTRYSVTPSATRIVVGVRAPIFQKMGSSKRYELVNVSYVPYSKDLATPELVAAGDAYLSDLVTNAFSNLRNKHIPSHAFPDQLMADVIDPLLVKSIIVTEHTDTHLFASDVSSAIDQTLVMFGANKTDTFGYARSTANAVGIAQFIKSTYDLLVRRHPELDLIPDFVDGAVNHANAVRAEIILLDANIAELPTPIKAQYLTDRAETGRFLTASYNGGATRMRRAYAAWQENWALLHTTELPSLEKQRSVLMATITSIKKQIKKASPVTEKKLRADLSTASSSRDSIDAKITAIKKASLPRETVAYVANADRVYHELALAETPAPIPTIPTLPLQTDNGTAEPQQICFSDGGCVEAHIPTS